MKKIKTFITWLRNFDKLDFCITVVVITVLTIAISPLLIVGGAIWLFVFFVYKIITVLLPKLKILFKFLFKFEQHGFVYHVTIFLKSKIFYLLLLKFLLKYSFIFIIYYYNDYLPLLPLLVIQIIIICLTLALAIFLVYLYEEYAAIEDKIYKYYILNERVIQLHIDIIINFFFSLYVILMLFAFFSTTLFLVESLIHIMAHVIPFFFPDLHNSFSSILKIDEKTIYIYDVLLTEQDLEILLGIFGISYTIILILLSFNKFRDTLILLFICCWFIIILGFPYYVNSFEYSFFIFFFSVVIAIIWLWGRKTKIKIFFLPTYENSRVFKWFKRHW